MDSKRTGSTRISRNIHNSSFGRRDEIIEAISRKLIVPQGKENAAAHVAEIPSQHELMPIMRDSMQRAHDADYAFDILSDLELAAQFAISSILSSKDLITTALIYDCNNQKVPLDLRSEMLRIVSRHFDDEYKLPSHLYDILYESLFKSGAYAAAVIPESSIDLILASGRDKVASESFKKSIRDAVSYKGILGSTSKAAEPTGFGMEALFQTQTPLTAESAKICVGDEEMFSPMTITDNIDVLKVPRVQAASAKAKIESTYNVGLEAFDMGRSLQAKVASSHTKPRGAEVASGERLDKTNNDMYDKSAYSVRSIEDVPVATAAGRPNVGHPLVQHIPTEAVIPVHVPGDFKSHVGYLVLLDRLGNPVSRHDLVNSTQAWTWVSGDASSHLLKDAAEGLGINHNKQEKWTISKLTRSYAELVEQKLINSLRNGVYGDSVAVARPQEVYRIMMARCLAKKQTQILYIPVEQMTYFAFDYTDAGTGRSLTDRNKVTIAARAAVQFAATQASILNATRVIQYDVKLTPEDREGDKTIDDYKHRIMQGKGGRIPFTGTIDDMEAYFMNAGVTMNIEGNDYYPDMKIGVSDVTPDYKVPDESMMEQMAKNNYRGFGIDPDLILSPQSIEYATQVVSKDLIATKQTVQRQEKFRPLITHFCRSYIRSSGPLMGELADAILTHITSDGTKQADVPKGTIGKYLNDFIYHLDASLPAPDMSMLGSQMEAFEKESAAYDKIIESFLDDEFLSAVGLEIDVRSAQTMVKNYHTRNWFRKNNVCPDLLDMFDNPDIRGDYIKLIADDNVGIAEFIYKAINRASKRVQTVINNHEVAENAPQGSGGGGGDYDSDSDGDGDGDYGDEGEGDFGDDGDGGSDDFGGGDDFDAGDDGDADGDFGSDDGGDTDDGDVEEF